MGWLQQEPVINIERLADLLGVFLANVLLQTLWREADDRGALFNCLIKRKRGEAKERDIDRLKSGYSGNIPTAIPANTGRSALMFAIISSPVRLTHRCE